MFPLPISPLWILRGFIMLAICAGFAFSHHKGYQEANEIWIAKNTASDKLTLETKIKKDAFNLKQSQELQAKFDSEAMIHEKQLEIKNDEIENLKRDIRSGALRLSIAIASNKTSGTEQDKSTGTTGASTGTESAVIVPEIAESILGIAGSIKQSVQERNECIRLYNEMKDTINYSKIE